MGSKYKETDFNRITPIPISTRDSKVRIEDFVDPNKTTSPAPPLEIFPDILKGNDLKSVVRAIKEARAGERPILWMIGAHVIKCGLSLYLNSLMDQSFITSLTAPGSVTVHDIELAFFGKTSEDVAVELPEGRFGMAQETADHFAAACSFATERALGLGEGLGAYVQDEKASYASHSILAHSYAKSVPSTIHVAFGTDITHQHPSFPAAQVGELTTRDFRILTSVVGDAFDGGVIVLFGSAVVLPEVFLKAVSVNYNLGRKPRDVTTVGFDMMPQYRVRENVLSRPFQGAGASYSLTGHHEIMLPLLYHLLVHG